MTGEPRKTAEDPVLGDRYEHESFGIAGFSRVSSTGTNLFGSALRHHAHIILEIQGAAMWRNTGTHSTHISPNRETIVQIAMSEAQFGRLISTFNRAEGVPVTITRVGGAGMPEPPVDITGKSFVNELKADIVGIENLAKGLVQKVVAACSKKGALTAAEKADLRESAEAVVAELSSNLPFLQSQFEDAMESVRLRIEALTVEES